jgi:hypothetical protein
MPAPTPYRPVDLSQPGAKYLPKEKKQQASGLTLNEKLAVKALTRSGQAQIQSLLPNPDVQPAPARKFGKDELKASVQRISQRVWDYLEADNRLEQRLEFASLKDITVMAGILTDKMQLLEGQPTQILGHTQHAKMDEVAGKLQELIKQRGLGQKVTLTERKAEIEIP